MHHNLYLSDYMPQHGRSFSTHTPPRDLEATRRFFVSRDSVDRSFCGHILAGVEVSRHRDMGGPTAVTRVENESPTWTRR